jgi:hypothetical protein
MCTDRHQSDSPNAHCAIVVSFDRDSNVMLTNELQAGNALKPISSTQAGIQVVNSAEKEANAAGQIARAFNLALV